jgi:branched-subunit amino acid aminotransferase/4-amino-4-deoxychorismate lyase
MGKYKPETNDLAFDFSHSPVEEEFYIPTALDLTTEMMRAPVRLGEIGLFEDPKPDHAVFTIKTLSSAYYVLAALAKTDLNCKYIFIQDTQGTILEELSSNVILRKGDQWISPYSNAGMVIGATLRYLKSAYGFQIQEKAFDYEEMKAADQIYLCRASTGIFRIR